VTVTGEIRFAEPPELRAGSVAYVRLLDTTYADAAAQVVATQVLRGFAGSAAVEFSLEAGDIEPRRRYTVSVHVSVAGVDRIQPGDFLNMQDYPVLTGSYPERVCVAVRRVK